MTTLLGHALSRAAGIPYPTLVGERILDPPGMEDTAITLPPENGKWTPPGRDLADPDASLSRPR